MARKYIKKQVLLVAKEGTGSYGISPTLNNVNYKGILMESPQLTPAAEIIQRNFIRDSFTKMVPVVGRKSVGISFSAELKGCADAASPATKTSVTDLIEACGMVGAVFAWSDAINCTHIYWLELVNGDDCSETAPLSSVWLVEDSGGIPVNRRAVVAGLVRRKLSDTDTGHNDLLIIALDDNTGLDLSKSQGLQGDNSGAPDGTTFATVRVDGDALMQQGLCYRPSSNAVTIRDGSISLAYYLDGILHKTPGGIGSLELTTEDGQVPKLNFSFQGLWSDPVDLVPPDGIAFLSHVGPSACNQNLTMGERSGDILTSVYRPSFSRLSVDLGNTVTADVNLNATNCAGEFFISDREPSAGLDPAVEDLATFNPWTTWAEGQTRVLTMCLGQDIGNRVALCLPAAGYESLGYGDKDGRATYDMKLKPTGDKDDELLLFIG